MQDRLDPALAPTNFAQPLVFFRLDPLGELGASPICTNLKYFRLRVPARGVSRHLHALPQAFPILEFLDMSTSSVTAKDVEGLLGGMSHLQVLVLDGCPIVSQRTDVQLHAGEPFLQWMELGKQLAITGLTRANAREKKLKAWTEEYYSLVDQRPGDKGAPVPREKKVKRGRRGVATATVSLRQPSPERARLAAAGITVPLTRIPGRDERVRVLPAPPALRSLATGLPGGGSPEAQEAARAEFERGWAAGISRLSSVRYRHLVSYQNGISRIVRFAERGSEQWAELGAHGEQGLAGLVDVCDDASIPLNQNAPRDEAEGSGRIGDCPVLCLAGPGRDETHVDGCGHQMGWRLYKDDL